MPLPEEFNEWEHLQHVIRRAHNSTVRDFFHSQADNDIDTPKGAAKQACLMKDDDTANMTIIRLWLFWVICRKMRDNFEPYYGVPIASFDAEVKYRPQITCFFLEDVNDVQPDYRPVEGQLSIRLMDETSSTLTDNNLQQYATRINNEFGRGNGFVWRKGKNLYTYVDKARGHRFKILTRNEADALEIVRKLLDIAQDPYDDSFLRFNGATNSSAAFPNVPANQTILGKTYKEPRKRPLAEVRFMYASIKIHGLPKPIILVDKSGYWSEAIIRAW